MFNSLYSNIVAAHLRINPIVYSFIIAVILLITSIDSVEAAVCPAGGGGGTGC